MIRRNVLKLLGALSLAPVLQVSANETYRGTKIIRLDAELKNVFKGYPSKRFPDVFCSLKNDKEQQVWCPLYKEKRSQKEVLDTMFLFSEHYEYCYIIRYNDLIGYLWTSEPHKLMSIFE